MPYFVASFLIALGVILGVRQSHFWQYWGQHSEQSSVSRNIDMPKSCDNLHFVQDKIWFEKNYTHSRNQQAFPEHVCGVVVRVYPEKYTKSGRHGYFLMKSNQGDAYIRIVSNLDEMGGQWPWVHEGDKVDVQGRYYYNGERRQGIDWTHHGTSHRWQWDGFVVVNGELHQ